MSKLTSSDILKVETIKRGNTNQTHFYLSFCVNKLNCCVCGEKTFRIIKNMSYILSKHFIYFNGIYYFVPAGHQNCIELFDLNPLAYE